MIQRNGRESCLDVQGDCLPGERLDEDLHATAEAQHQMQSRFFLDIVVRQCASVFQLLASEDEALPWWKAQEET